LAGRPGEADFLLSMNGEYLYAPGLAAFPGYGPETLPWVIGFGGTFSNILSEMYSKLGFQRVVLFIPPLRASSMFKIFLPFYIDRGWASHAKQGLFPTDNLVNMGYEYQGMVGFYLGRFSAYFGITASSGFFTYTTTEDVRQRIGIPYRFVTVGMEWGRFGFETSNDLEGNTDIGPSYGAKISYAVF
jgi:hypothetical protein